MTDLVEQVARILDSLDPERVDHDLCLRQARAVIPVVREDCAKVAEDFTDEGSDPWTWPKLIAAALREGRG